jgi:hypothetical protein
MSNGLLASMNKTRAAILAGVIGTAYVVMVKQVFPLRPLDALDFVAGGAVGSIVAIGIELIIGWLPRKRRRA